MRSTPGTGVGRPARRPAALLAVAAAWVAMLLAPFPIVPEVARAADDPTSLWIDYEPGYAGQAVGKSVVIRGAEADGVFPQTYGQEGRISIMFRAFDAGLGEWSVGFAPRPGEPLVPGTYPDAVSAGARGPGQPGIDIFGDGFSCQELTGTFTIHEIEVVDWQLRVLSASFSQHCEPGLPTMAWPGWLHGEVRLNAADPGFRAAAATPRSIDFGAHDTGTAVASTPVAITATGDRAIRLGSASVIGDDPGSFSIASDTCSGAILDPGGTCTVDLAARPGTNRVLTAALEVPDDTRAGHQLVVLKVQGLGEVDAYAAVGPARFYPFVDGYRDRLVVQGDRGAPVAVAIRITPTGQTRPVLHGSIAAATGPFRWAWDGREDDGLGAPAGRYDVEVILRDGAPNTRVVSVPVTLSRDRVTWVTRRITLPGRSYTFAGRTGNGSIRTTASHVPGGVRITSGSGFVAVGYTFRVQQAAIRGPMTIEVSGGSPNGHRAVLAAWNAQRGRYLDLDSYDAARAIGPADRTWATRTDGQDHIQGARAYAVVMATKGLGGGGSAVFDIGWVRITYRIGTLHHVAPASGAARRHATAATSDARVLLPLLVRLGAPDAPRLTRQVAPPEPLPAPSPVPSAVPTATPTPAPSPLPVEPPASIAPSMAPAGDLRP